jgi:hypothetical protein
VSNSPRVRELACFWVLNLARDKSGEVNDLLDGGERDAGRDADDEYEWVR